MSYNFIPPTTTPAERAMAEECNDITLTLSAYTVTRIVYEVIKLYMMNNAPADVGIKLAQKYDIDDKKTGILLDIGYNWRTKELNKVPAVYVQRGDVSLKGKTIGEKVWSENTTGKEGRVVFCEMPVIITCIAAEPIAVVENLADYIKQPLLYFRRNIQEDFGIRHFLLEKISAPKLLAEGKNNFFVDLVLNVTFDDTWTIHRNSLKVKRITVDLFDAIGQELQKAII